MKENTKKEESMIQMYFHCRNCMSGKLEVGAYERGLDFEKGIEVYCPDCEDVVARFKVDLPELECECCKCEGEESED